MTFDILSDLHINAWSKQLYPNEKEVSRIWDRLEPKGDVLLVAGDIGEIPLQNANFLKILKQIYYKEIVCVLGNHDLHCLYNRALYLYDETCELIQMSGWDNYQDKIDETKQLYAEAGIHILDGNIITIDAIKIGGAMGWYDGAYTKTHRIDLGQHHFFRYREYEDMQELWKGCMPDDDINPLKGFDALFKAEYAKLESIVEQCDIMMSHINPSILKEHQNPDWKDSPTCGFYSFEGRGLIEKFKGKLWLFGHSHYRGEYELANNHGEFKLAANAFGYPSEKPGLKVQMMTYAITKE